MTREPSHFEPSIPLVYIETTIPSGLTIDDYRRSRQHGGTRRHRLRIAPRTQRRR